MTWLLEIRIWRDGLIRTCPTCGEQIPRAAEVCCDRTARGQYLQGHTTSGEVEVDARRRFEDLPRVVRIDAAGATVVDDEGQPVRTQPDVAALAALA